MHCFILTYPTLLKYGLVPIILIYRDCLKCRKLLFVSYLMLDIMPILNHCLNLLKFCHCLNLLPFSNLNLCSPTTKKTIPAIFQNTWILNSERIIGDNDLQSRNASNFNIPHNRLTSTDCHPLYLFPKLWDNFNEHSITIIRNKLEFGSKLKDHLVSKLSSTVTCNKLFCPSCSFNPRTT